MGGNMGDMGGNMGNRSYNMGGMGGNMGGSGMGGGKPASLLEGMDMFAGAVETSQVTIPNSMAGCIIGPKGVIIKRIRAESRAMITVEECEKDSEERIITIKGNAKASQHAKYLLQQAVRENAGAPTKY